MSLKHVLQELGYSQQDAAIYLALLKVGESSVGAIISETGYHRDIVYGAFNRLEQQGLLQSIEKKKIRHYLALDPELLVRKIREKADLAGSILPELKHLFSQPAVSVRIYEGPEGLEETEKDWAASLKDNEEFYCIGGAGKAWYDVAKNFNYQKYHSALQKRGILLKTITYANELAGIVESESVKFNEIRVLPESFRVPSSTIIYADKIQIQVFGERFMSIVIQSKQISDAYRQYFHTLWNMGKKTGKSK